QIFLGREINQHRDYSEATAIKIDEEVKRLVGKGYETAKGVLASNHDALIRIALALLEREVLDANEIKLLMDGKDLPKITPPPRGHSSHAHQYQAISNQVAGRRNEEACLLPDEHAMPEQPSPKAAVLWRFRARQSIRIYGIRDAPGATPRATNNPSLAREDEC